MLCTDGIQHKTFEKETPPDGAVSPHRVVCFVFLIYLIKIPIAHPVTSGMPSAHTAVPFEDPFRP